MTDSFKDINNLRHGQRFERAFDLYFKGHHFYFGL
jgi:hypothetical protein